MMDGCTTCHPATHGPAEARTMTLQDARAVRADLAHHADADVIAAARVITDESPDPEEIETALALLAIMEGGQ